jgi:hypothetical protein
MGKELLAGSESLARVPLEWIGHEAHAIAICQFDFEELDSLDDRIREELREHGTAEPFLREWVRREEQGCRAEIVNAVLAMIVTSKKPGLAAVQLGFAAGVLLTSQKTGPQWAKEFGVSKEAFQEGVDSFRKKLGLRQTRFERDEAARECMRQSNYRRRKKG